jgi:hypothetical protein
MSMSFRFAWLSAYQERAMHNLECTEDDVRHMIASLPQLSTQESLAF